MKLSSVLTDEQLVYHSNDCGTWIGQFDAKLDGIVYDGVVYHSLCAFARAHSGKPCSGWRDCLIEYEGEIIPASALKHIKHFHDPEAPLKNLETMVQ
jgi:hypothetical protein